MEKYIHICLNGHYIFSDSWVYNPEFCEICGKPMIDECPTCGEFIRKWRKEELPYMGNPRFDRPAYCRYCGHPYPWTQAAIAKVEQTISSAEELDPEQRSELIDSIPDVIAETPGTPLAAAKFKKTLASVGKITAEALVKSLLDIACSYVRSALGL